MHIIAQDPPINLFDAVMASRSKNMATVEITLYWQDDDGYGAAEVWTAKAHIARESMAGDLTPAVIRCGVGGVQRTFSRQYLSREYNAVQIVRAKVAGTTKRRV
jgi:hypothetical protein